jgi:integrase
MLKDREVANAKPRDRAFKMYDSNGLSLLVKPNGGKYWRYKFHRDGIERVLALGVYPSVGLRAARDARNDARAQIDEGQDPGIERRNKKMLARLSSAKTFEPIGREWFEKQRAGWSPKYAANVLNVLEKDVYSSLGPQPVASIKTSHVLAMLHRIESRGALVKARRILALTKSIFRYAVISGKIDHSPATEIKPRDALRRPRPVKHMPAIPEDELGACLRAVRNSAERIEPQTRDAIFLLLLTAARTGELRFAEWSEFDLKRALWTVPASHHKMGQAHLVPLSRQAIVVLERLKKNAGGSALVFPNANDDSRPMSENTVLYGIYRLGWHRRMTGHGARALFSTTLNRLMDDPLLGELRDIGQLVELCLGHAPRDKVRAAYNRDGRLEARRKLLQIWADLLDAKEHGAQVIKLRA